MSTKKTPGPTRGDSQARRQAAGRELEEMAVISFKFLICRREPLGAAAIVCVFMTPSSLRLKPHSQWSRSYASCAHIVRAPIPLIYLKTKTLPTEPNRHERNCVFSNFGGPSRRKLNFSLLLGIEGSEMSEPNKMRSITTTTSTRKKYRMSRRTVRRRKKHRPRSLASILVCRSSKHLDVSQETAAKPSGPSDSQPYQGRI